jgi:hypothetical protein
MKFTTPVMSGGASFHPDKMKESKRILPLGASAGGLSLSHRHKSRESEPHPRQINSNLSDIVLLG